MNDVLDAQSLAAFATDYQRLRAKVATLEVELEEARVFVPQPRDSISVPHAVPESATLNLPSGAFRYPSPSETTERGQGSCRDAKVARSTTHVGLDP